ncbi:MAG: DNA polymerase III subunit beta [Chloroflexi bacterium]|nr:DNA polymerase III subunit beta [Chloroflexota bacterium]
MLLSCLQENLNRGLGIVGRAVATRTTLPITQNVLLATDQSLLKLSATNLEIAISTWIGAKVETEGAITVPARLLSEFVGSLPAERVDMEVAGGGRSIQLRCGRFQARFNGTDAEEFPPIPRVEDGVLARMEPQALRTAIGQVAFAAATEDSRPVLTGVKVELGRDLVTLAAADGFRLAVHYGRLLEPIAEPSGMIVPARTLTELSRLLGDQEEPVEMVLTPQKSQVLFRLKNIEVVSQLVQGTFPSYAQLIPSSYSTRAVVSRADFQQATRAASIFARDGSGIVRLQVVPGKDGMGGKLVVSARAEEIGDDQGELEASVEGEEAKIAFNYRYLSDLLAAIDTQQVALEASSPSSPGVVRPVGSESYVHVVMPMFVQW